MGKEKNITVISCDSRQIFMADTLKKKGFNVFVINDFDDENSLKNAIHLSDIIVGPVPLRKIGNYMEYLGFLSHLISIKQNDTAILFAGKIDVETKEILESSNIKCIDYMESDKISYFNTIATAEGIIAEAIIHKNTNLHESNVVILGFGKCAKTLARKLDGLCAHVTIAARKESALSEASSMGYKTINMSELKDNIHKYEYIFNTIPALVINEDIINNISKESMIFDIASMPGGVDKVAALKHNISVYHSLGIPGKYSPKASGDVLGYYLIEIIHDEHLHKINM